MDESHPPAAADIGGAHVAIVQVIARLLAEAATLAEAAPEMLAAVAAPFAWECAALWDLDRDGRALHCVATWPPGPGPFADFLEVSQGMAFPAGIGLPGRVWGSRAPVAVTDVVLDPNFPRARAAAQAGLHGAAAVPVGYGDAVVGVMEFFRRDVDTVTPDQLAAMTAVGRQIALYVERQRTADELERFFELSLDLLCVANLDGYFIRVNPAWTRVLGYEPHTLREEPFMAFVHPDDREATTATLGALATGDAGERLREPLSRQATAATGGCSGRRCPTCTSARSTPRRATSPIASGRPSSRRSRPSGWRAWSASSTWPAGAPRRRRSPRASSWPT